MTGENKMLVCFNVRLHRDDTHLKIIQSELNKLLLFLFGEMAGQVVIGEQAALHCTDWPVVKMCGHGEEFFFT